MKEYLINSNIDLQSIQQLILPKSYEHTNYLFRKSKKAKSKRDGIDLEIR